MKNPDQLWQQIWHKTSEELPDDGRFYDGPCHQEQVLMWFVESKILFLGMFDRWQDEVSWFLYDQINDEYEDLGSVPDFWCRPEDWLPEVATNCDHIEGNPHE